MGFRITSIIILFTLAYSYLAFHLWQIQIKKGEVYRAQAASLHQLTGILLPQRGTIYFTDKDGGRIPAAINKEYPVIYAVPAEIKDPVAAARVLSQISGRSEAELRAVLSNKEDQYELIVKKASADKVELVKKSKLEGVYVTEEPYRFYPLKRLAAHLLGFISVAEEDFGVGRYGIEAYYNDRLMGVPGASKGDRVISPKNGGDLYLTIDRNIQFQAENTLDRLITRFGAVGGTVIVSDPKTGKILAMASRPDFDPNDYSQYEIKRFLNPAVQSVYEPGSIFKVITMAAAIDAGKITPETTYVDTGSLTLNGKTIKNWDLKAHGRLTMTNVIEKSVNTGAAFAERALGHQAFYEYLVKFGFKEKRGIDLPGEIIGSLKPLEEDRRDIDFATASFGQGVSVTPISLLTAISAIANHGLMMRPYLNAELEPQPIRRVISEEASRQVVQMMVSAVDKAEVAKIQGYNVAGKTGTAQVPNFATGGYTDEVINTYVGFAPAYDPKFIILLKMDKPAGAPLAGMTIVPAFRELAEFVINYYNIPPDRVNLQAAR